MVSGNWGGFYLCACQIWASLIGTEPNIDCPCDLQKGALPIFEVQCLMAISKFIPLSLRPLIGGTIASEAEERKALLSKSGERLTLHSWVCRLTQIISTSHYTDPQKRESVSG